MSVHDGRLYTGTGSTVQPLHKDMLIEADPTLDRSPTWMRIPSLIYILYSHLLWIAWSDFKYIALELYRSYTNWNCDLANDINTTE